MSNTSINYTVDSDRFRWPGSGSAVVSGMTPFGYFDRDPAFVIEAPKAADAAARGLGFPAVDIELLDYNFYACFAAAT